VGAAQAGHDDDERYSFSFSYRSDGVQARYDYRDDDRRGGYDRHDSNVCNSHRRSQCGACGRMVIYTERVWQPGYYKTVYVEPVYDWRRDHCGRPVRVMVRPGCTQRVWVEGCWQTRQVSKWVPHHGGHGDRYADRGRDDDRRYDRDDDRRHYRR
jgi:hypothetical protein